MQPKSSPPNLPFELTPDFARGLLEARGHILDDKVSWVGTPRVITTLGLLIRDATGAAEPRTTEGTRIQRIEWNDPNDIRLVSQWLYAEPGKHMIQPITPAS